MTLRVGPALREVAILAPLLALAILAFAYVRADWPSPTVWLISAGVIVVRFVLVALGLMPRMRVARHRT